MTNTERENFYRNATLIVDHTNESFTGLLFYDLTKQGITLLQLIRAKQHEIYHLCYNTKSCCMCPPGSTTPVFRHINRILNPAQLDILLDTTVKLPGHNQNSQTKHCCCPANPNINYNQLDLTLTRCFLLNFTTIIPYGSSERLAVDELIKFRNESYGHATEGKISDHDYQINKAQIEKSIMVLAKAQGRESEFKQKLNDAAVRPLDETIQRQYQINLMETVKMMQSVKSFQSALRVKSLPDCLTKDLCDFTVTEGCDAHFEIWTKEYAICSLWLQDGLDIVRSERFIPGSSGKIHSLKIINTCLSDKGVYAVRVKDIERQALLDVEEYFTKNLQSVKCIEGETAEFTCEVVEDSLPACWKKNGIELENDGKYEILQEGKMHRLSIKNCDQNDKANYTVSINNRVRTASLDVKEYFIKSLGNMTCVEGESVNIECEVLEENTTAHWFKDGTEVSTFDKYKMERHGNLHRLVVHNARLDDKGEYTVEIKHCVRHSHLIVQEYFIKPLGTMTCIEGDSVQFECKVLDDNQTAHWFKDGIEVNTSEKYNVEKHGNLHRLVVNNTRLDDKGEYSVKIKYCVRHSQLIVQEYFIKPLGTKTCIEGESVQFECKVLDDNQTAHWFKDGTEVNTSEKYNVEKDGNLHRLVVNNTRLDDKGEYSVKIKYCVPHSQLIVQEYFIKPLDPVTCIEGETVQFECEVLDYNQTAHWFKDGIEVSTSDKYKMERHVNLHRLVVNNTRLDYKGEYSVKIKYCVRHSQLIVQEMPTAIKHLSKEDRELYMDIINSGTETRYYIRIVIIGEHGVGKTCLVKRLLKQSTTGVQSTDGIDTHQCRMFLRDGKWIFDEVSDKKKELLSRIKIASHTSTVKEGTLQETSDSLGACGFQDDDSRDNSKRDSLNTSENSVVKRKKKPASIKNITEKITEAPKKIRNSMIKVWLFKRKNYSKPKLNKTINRALIEKVSKGLDAFLNGIEQVEVPDDKFLECGILDFAGEKEYYATHPMFVNQNALYLLVANIMKDVKPITIEDGFYKIGEYVDFWLDTIHSCGVEETKDGIETNVLYPPAIIVCTRIDECRNNVQTRKEDFRKQLLSVVRNEAKKKHIREICYVSNIESKEEDFNALRDTIFKYGKQLKTFADNLPLRWIRLERALDILREAELNILSWPDIIEVSSKCLIGSEDEINLFLKYQHNVGNVIYFESLKDYIILKQNWLANAFRCLVSDKFDSNLKLTDEWKILEDTGKLENSLIEKLFDKEPQLDFNKHRSHLLNVLEMFGIIVNLSTLTDKEQMQISPTYYLPCMISEKASFIYIIEMFNAKKDNCKRTPWLCIEFDFMPLDVFSHILCYYISQYAMCTEPSKGRVAIYHGMGVFFLDSTKFIKFILCFCKNTIALQIWQWRNMKKGKCKEMLKELEETIARLNKKFKSRRLSYSIKLKCSDGNIHNPAGRHSYSELVDLGDEYFCEEHSESHKIQDFFQTWFENYKKVRNLIKAIFNP